MRLGVADSLATHFKTDVFVCPDFPAPQDDWRYHYFFKGTKGHSQPDFYFDNHHWELESYEGSFAYGKLSKMIRRVSVKEQSDRIILKIHHDISMKTATESINGLFKKSAKVRRQITHVIIVDKNGKVYPIK